MGWAIQCGPGGCRTVWVEDRPPAPYEAESEPLRKARIHAHISQREAADFLGLSPVEFSHRDNGREPFTAEQRARLERWYAEATAAWQGRLRGEERT